ncbi:hypothetical protein B0T24DRAFT_197843 [Lasiosphaeria ovina]|uniref:Uncharacterized protein n=1 Tax=Lasiosphaeria ovina TaxID=92902 RepID=A0AAE0TUW7_9PEZI|nr:hypothetical protein B0T24DRAFT_197843 [Lasiosphaeria ovina]
MAIAIYNMQGHCLAHHVCIYIDLIYLVRRYSPLFYNNDKRKLALHAEIRTIPIYPYGRNCPIAMIDIWVRTRPKCLESWSLSKSYLQTPETCLPSPRIRTVGSAGSLRCVKVSPRGRRQVSTSPPGSMGPRLPGQGGSHPEFAGEVSGQARRREPVIADGSASWLRRTTWATAFATPSQASITIRRNAFILLVLQYLTVSL